MNQDRRLLLRTVAATGIAAFALGGGFGYARRKWKGDNEAPTDYEALKTLLRHLATTPAMADSFTGGKPTIYELARSLGIKANTRSEDLRALLAEKVAGDFASDRTHKIHDWLLSDTEIMIWGTAINVFGVAAAELAEMLTFENAPFEEFLTVTNWGPQSTYQGVKFNEQPDGHCGFWFLAGEIPTNLQLYVKGVRRRVRVSDTRFTSGIYSDMAEFIGDVGPVDVVIYDDINQRRQKIGDFVVLRPFKRHVYADGSESQVFGELQQWGPQRSKVGEAFNPRPRGDAAFWARIGSMTNRIKLTFNGHEVDTSVRVDLITAVIDRRYLPQEPGSFPVRLVNHDHNESLLLGELIVTKDTL